MLSFPSYALLKKSMPKATIYALVPEYTYDMAKACRWIDEVIIDPGPVKGFISSLKLSSQFRQLQFDAIISLYSTNRTGLAAFLARIPYRLAPATKLAQLFYNHRLTQRRSLSEKPEFAYNCDLIREFCRHFGITVAESEKPPLLEFDHSLKISFCQKHKITPEKKLVFIHTGSGGSARNLSLEQYALLAQKLTSTQGHHIIITAGPGEYETAHRFSNLLRNTPHTLYESRQGLMKFAEHIQFADLFIGGSTGPIHIAGALNTPTVAFYPRRRSATSLRWQTLNSDDNRMAFSPPEYAEEEDMAKIDMNDVARLVSKQFLLD